MDLIPLKVHGYFALFELKSTVIFICCLIISFFLIHQFITQGTRADHGSYVVTTYMTTTLHKTEKQIIKEKKKQRRREKEKEKEERRKK